MLDRIVEASIRAASRINAPRLYQTERGYHGEFYCELRAELKHAGVLSGELLLEMEYQKGTRHGTHQRPDIILHEPAEYHGRDVRENNIAVWALKRRASEQDAIDDFAKLDEMIAIMHYSLGVFVNIDATDTRVNAYSGRFPGSIQALAVSLTEGNVRVVVAAPQL